MKLRFEEKSDISAKDPCVVIQAERLSDQAREVMDYLEQFSVVNQVVIPIKTDDHLVMVKIDDIILAEIDKNVLTIYTVYNRQNLYDERDTDKLSASHQSSKFFTDITSCCYEYRSFGIPIG